MADKQPMPRPGGELRATVTVRKDNAEDAHGGSRGLPVDDPGQELKAVARLSIGVTVQPRQYEALRVEVGGDLPCRPEELLDRSAYDRLLEVVGQELTDLVQKEKQRWNK